MIHTFFIYKVHSGNLLAFSSSRWSVVEQTGKEERVEGKALKQSHLQVLYPKGFKSQEGVMCQLSKLMGLGPSYSILRANKNVKSVLINTRHAK